MNAYRSPALMALRRTFRPSTLLTGGTSGPEPFPLPLPNNMENSSTGPVSDRLFAAAGQPTTDTDNFPGDLRQRELLAATHRNAASFDQPAERSQSDAPSHSGAEVQTSMTKWRPGEPVHGPELPGRIIGGPMGGGSRMRPPRKPNKGEKRSRRQGGNPTADNPTAPTPPEIP